MNKGCDNCIYLERLGYEWPCDECIDGYDRFVENPRKKQGVKINAFTYAEAGREKTGFHKKVYG